MQNANTVTLGDKTLTVRPATLGLLRNHVLPARRRLEGATTEEETVDALADLIFAYVGHNEGATRDFVLDHAPADPWPLLSELIKASGQKVAPPGEAPRP